MGTSTATFAASAWHQANVTYDDSTGAFAFRVDRAADNSGTSVQTITVVGAGVGYNPQLGTGNLNAKIAALIVYGRVLTGPEITSVENYILAKWGV
jgi:Flp pilus assembly protein TadG